MVVAVADVIAPCFQTESMQPLFCAAMSVTKLMKKLLHAVLVGEGVIVSHCAVMDALAHKDTEIAELTKLGNDLQLLRSASLFIFSFRGASLWPQ